MYRHRCLESIRKEYTYNGKYNYQQQYKAIIEAVLVSTPYKFNNNSTIPPGPSVTIINTSTIKSLRLFTEILDVKNKTAVQQVGDAKLKRKAVREGSMFWSNIT